MSVFGVFLVRIFRIWAEYGAIIGISTYSVRMREYTDQKNSKYGHSSLDESLEKSNIVGLLLPEAYSEPCHTSKMECFTKIFNGSKAIFQKKFRNRWLTVFWIHLESPKVIFYQRQNNKFQLAIGRRCRIYFQKTQELEAVSVIYIYKKTIIASFAHDFILLKLNTLCFYNTIVHLTY